MSYSELPTGVHRKTRHDTGRRTRLGRPTGSGLCRQAAEFVGDLADWQLFITLTFAWDASPDAAHAALKAFLRLIAAEHERRHLVVSWGGGRQFKGRLHYHILAVPYEGGDFRTDPRVLERLWHDGDCRVEPVRDREKASEYLVAHEFWNVAVVCDRTMPCRRKHGCRFDRPWPSAGENVTA
jgi:hypothetical protein